MAEDTRRPGWYFLAWKDGSMKDTQVTSGPFPTREEAVAERVKAVRDGFMTGLPYEVKEEKVEAE